MSVRLFSAMASSGKGHRDDLEITAIGALYSGPLEKKYWSSSRGKEKYPYPIGYQATRWHGGHSYFMEVREGPRGPLFAVTCEEGIACSGQTPFAPWEEIFKKRHTGMKKIVPRNSSASLDGPEMFGFTHPLVQRLCRDLVVSANGLAQTSAGEGSTKGKVKNLQDPTLDTLKDGSVAKSSENFRRKWKRGSASYISSDEGRVDHSSDRQEMKMKLGHTPRMQAEIQDSGIKLSRRLSRRCGERMKGLEGIFSNLTKITKPEVPVEPRDSPSEDEGVAKPGVSAKRRRSSRSLASEVNVEMPSMTDVKISSSDLLSASGSLIRRKSDLSGKDRISSNLTKSTLHPFGKQHTAVVTVDVVEDRASPRLEKQDFPDSLFDENEEIRMTSENRRSTAKPANTPVLNVLDEASPNRFNGKKRLRLAKSDRGLPVRPAKIEKNSPVRVLLAEEPSTLSLLTTDEETRPSAVIPVGTPITSVVAPETFPAAALSNSRKFLDSHQSDKYETKVDLTQSQGVLSIDLMCPSIEDVKGPEVESAELSLGKSESVSQQDGVFLLLEAVNLTKMTKRDVAKSDGKRKEIFSDKDAIAGAKISMDGQDDRRRDGYGIEREPEQTIFDKCGGRDLHSSNIFEEGSINRNASERSKEDDVKLPENFPSDKNSTVEVDISRDAFFHTHGSPHMGKAMREPPPIRAAETLAIFGGNVTEDLEADRIPGSNPLAAGTGEVGEGVRASATKLTSNYVDTLNVCSAGALIDVKREPSFSVAVSSTCELSESTGNALTSRRKQATLMTSSVVEDVPNLLGARRSSALRAQETSGTEEQVNDCVASMSAGSRNTVSGAVDSSIATKPSVVEETHVRNSDIVNYIAPIPFDNKATNISPAPSVRFSEEISDSKVTPTTNSEMVVEVPTLPVVLTAQPSGGNRCYENYSRATLEIFSGEEILPNFCPDHDKDCNVTGEAETSTQNSGANDVPNLSAWGLETITQRTEAEDIVSIASKPHNEELVFRNFSSTTSRENEISFQSDGSHSQTSLSTDEGTSVTDHLQEKNAEVREGVTVSLGKSKSSPSPPASVRKKEPTVTFGQVMEDGAVTAFSPCHRVDLLTVTLPDEHNEIATPKKIHKDSPGENCSVSLAVSAEIPMDGGTAGHIMENGVITALPPDRSTTMDDTVPYMVSGDPSQAADFVGDNGNVVTTTADVLSNFRPDTGAVPDKRPQALPDADSPALVSTMKETKRGALSTPDILSSAHGLTTVLDPVQDVDPKMLPLSLEKSILQLSSDVNISKGSCSTPNETLFANPLPVDTSGKEELGEYCKGDSPCLCSSTPEMVHSTSSLVEADSGLEKQYKTTVRTSTVDPTPGFSIGGEDLRENVNLSNEIFSGDQGAKLTSNNDWICRPVPLEVQEHSSELASANPASESGSIHEIVTQSEEFLGCLSSYPTVGIKDVPQNLVGQCSLYSRCETAGCLNDSQAPQGGQDITGNLERDGAYSEEKVSSTNENSVGITSLPEQERRSLAENSSISGRVRESVSSIAGEPLVGDKEVYVSNDTITYTEGQQKGSEVHVSMNNLTSLDHDDYADIMNDSLDNLNSFQNELELEEHKHILDAADPNSKVPECKLDVICSLPSDFPLSVSSQMHSESSEQESLSAPLTKSMLTLLLPRSVPLLGKGSKQKHRASIGGLETRHAIPVAPMEGEMRAEKPAEASQAEELQSVGLPSGQIADFPPFLDSAHTEDQMLYNVSENDIAERYFSTQEMTLTEVTSDVPLTQLANNSITGGAGRAIRSVQFDTAPSRSAVMSSRDGGNGQVLIECQSSQADPEEDTPGISDSGEIVLRKEDSNVSMEVAVETLSRGCEDSLQGDRLSKAKLDLPFIRDDPDFDVLVNSKAEGRKNLTTKKGFLHDLGSAEKSLVSVKEVAGTDLNIHGGPANLFNHPSVPLGREEGGGSNASENTLDYEGLVSTVKQLHENSKKMDPLFCIEHKLPVIAVVASLQGDKVRLCVVSGVAGGKERSFFVYEVSSRTNEAIKSQILCASEFTCEKAGHGTHQVQIPMEESAIRFSPDGQQLLLLDCFKLSSSCLLNTDNKDERGVNIVSFGRDGFRVNECLKCNASMQCLAVPGPRLVIAAGVGGCICCWEMDSDWRNCTEHFFLPRATRGDTLFSSVTRLSVMPGSPHMVLGCDYDGYFTLWDTKSRTILLSCHLPGHYVLKASWLETEPFCRAQVESSEQCPSKSQLEKNTWRDPCLGFFPCLVALVCNHQESDSTDYASGSIVRGENGMEWSCKTLMLRKDGISCGPGLPERALAMASLGRYGVVGTLEGLLQLWDITCGRMFCELNELEGSSIVKVVTNPSSRVLVAANVRGQVVLYIERDNFTLPSRT